MLLLHDADDAFVCEAGKRLTEVLRRLADRSHVRWVGLAARERNDRADVLGCVLLCSCFFGAPFLRIYFGLFGCVLFFSARC